MSVVRAWKRTERSDRRRAVQLANKSKFSDRLIENISVSRSVADTEVDIFKDSAVLCAAIAGYSYSTG